MAARPSTAATLVGRGTELAALDAALDRARGGEVVTVLVAGEAGIGKTRLVGEFADRAFAAGARLLTGACVDVGAATLPYGALVDALRDLPPDAYMSLEPPLRRALATLVPEAAVDEEPYAGDQRAVFGAVLRLLEQLGRDDPVVLLLEDVHWADRSTQDVLRFLVRGLRQTAVLVVLTHRTDELQRGAPVRRLLADLGREPCVETIALAPLSRTETAGQLAEVAGTPLGSEQVDRIYARSEGNPFFSEQLLLALDAGGPDAVPGTLRETLLARLDRLPPTAQPVVRVAAAVGRRVEHELLAQVCEQGDDVLDAALRACVAGHVLTVDRDRRGYVFRHALLAEVAAEDLLPGEARRLHRRIADLLADRPARAGMARAQQLAEIAHHRLQAGDPPAALAAAVAAARAAEEVHAMAEASRSYDAALGLWESVADAPQLTGIDLPHLLERAAECRWLGFGDAEISGRLRRRAIAELDAGAPALRRADYLSRLATTSCYHSIAASLPLHAQALSLVDERPTETGARVRARYAAVLMLLGDYAAAERQAGDAISTARAAGGIAAAQEADALVTLAVCRAMDGDVDGTFAALAAARPFATSLGDLRVVQRYYTNGSHVLSCFGRYEESVALAREGIAMHASAGLAGHGAIGVHENAAGALCALGRVDEAAAMIAGQLEHEPVAADTICLHLRRAQVHLVRGELDVAARLLAQLRGLSEAESFVMVPVCAMQADVALWRGELGTAREATLAGEALLVEAEQLDAAPLLAVAVRTAADARDAGEADRLVARLSALVGERLAPLPEPGLQLALAIAERTRLAPEPDPEAWRAVVAGFDALGRPYELAYGNWRLAEALAAARGDREELERALVAAHAAALGLGARHLLDVVGALARRARIALPAGDGAGAPGGDDAFAGLTPREREVLGLLAGGATNREIAGELFITEKTASVHVSNILAKLGAANRGQAAALAHQAGFVARV
jgi:DNA-binding CsgD family transcriptional regulator